MIVVLSMLKYLKVSATYFQMAQLRKYIYAHMCAKRESKKQMWKILTTGEYLKGSLYYFLNISRGLKIYKLRNWENLLKMHE